MELTIKIPYVVGDVVRAIAGGPKMTVTYIHDDTQVSCMWFDSRDVLHKSIFDINTLVVVQ